MDSQNELIQKKESNKSLWITGIVIGFLVLALVTNGFGIPALITGGSITNPEIPLAISGSPVIGNANAKVTIYEFTDFSCPFCARFALETSPLIENDYVKTGEAKIVFKYFPGHGSGTAAHEVALALNNQNPELFWEFADLAFSNQADTKDLAKMKSLAEGLGADMTALDSYLSSGKAQAQMQSDYEMGKSNKIAGTPSFIINGKIIEGAQPYQVFKTAIDNALK